MPQLFMPQQAATHTTEGATTLRPLRLGLTKSELADAH